MKTEIKLDAKDIQKIIAEKFNVELDKVTVMPFMKDVGYGMKERTEPDIKVTVEAVLYELDYM